MKEILTLILISSAIFPSIATELTITNVSFTGRPTDKTNPTLLVYATVRWENSWYNEKNKDGVWLFFKMNHQNDIRSQRHIPLKKSGHMLVHNYISNKINPGFYIPHHAAGVLIYPDQKWRGTIHWRLKFELDISKQRDIDFSNVVFGNVFGLEMVSIPTGSFYVGDADSLEQTQSSAFYEYTTKKQYRIESEKPINIGKNTGEIFYQNNETPQYRGDVAGTVNESFPKGFNAFWIMKYELTQGEYSGFLNSISNTPSQLHANFGGKMYYADRGTIRFENDKYITDYPTRPANFISWDDGCAFSDWAGLRPLTELEYEKACRGNKQPHPADFPWGSSSRDKVSRYYNEEGNLVLEKGLDEKDLSDSNLEFFGASWYWVMDLSGSVWERVVTIGSEKGRSFKGTHGDGRLGDDGNASNEDWPTNKEGGLGYRGSGSYGFGMRGDPYHRVSSRPYGSWGEGPRSVGYGFRAALTSN
jgi:formylglycine-generating enzyme required for sulfatase activity